MVRSGFEGDQFQVKRITLKPGAKISLQKHIHRAEHWVLVRGTAKVVKGKEKFTLRKNESTYIPPGVYHQLENPGQHPLDLIEIRTGRYLQEDDITRSENTHKGSLSPSPCPVLQFRYKMLLFIQNISNGTVTSYVKI